jgi:hypothetical protein
MVKQLAATPSLADLSPRLKPLVPEDEFLRAVAEEAVKDGEDALAGLNEAIDRADAVSVAK